MGRKQDKIAGKPLKGDKPPGIFRYLLRHQCPQGNCFASQPFPADHECPE